MLLHNLKCRYVKDVLMNHAPSSVKADKVKTAKVAYFYARVAKSFDSPKILQLQDPKKLQESKDFKQAYSADSVFQAANN